MVLGEELLFYKGEDADSFLKFLKKQHCSAVKRTSNIMSTEIFLYGTIHHFFQFFDTMENKTAMKVSILPERISEARSEMNLRASVLQDFFSHHIKGARIDEGAEWIALTSLLTRELPSSEPLSEVERTLIRDRYLLLALLDENKLIDSRGEGIYLKESIDPTSAMTTYPAHLFHEVDEALLINNSLKRRIITSTETVHTVVLGPEIVLFDGMELLNTMLNGLDVDPDSAMTMAMSITSKKVIVDRILALLRDRKTMTRDELIEALGYFDVEVPDTVDTFVYQLDRVFIGDIISDLRKLKAIQGKDTRIRCSG